MGGDRNFGYLLGDRDAKVAVLIDPSYSPESLVQRAKDQDLKVTHIINTHGHPDHTNGNVDWQVAKRLWLGSLPMALLIVFIVSLGAQVAKVDWLTKAIGIVVLITAIGLLVAPKLVAYAKGRRIGQPDQRGQRAGRELHISIEEEPRKPVEPLLAQMALAEIHGVGLAPLLGLDERVTIDYLKHNLYYRLGEAERRGLARFPQLAVQYDLAPGGIELVFRHFATA